MGNPASTLRYRVSKKRRRRQPQPVQAALESAFRRFGIGDRLAKYTFVLHWKEIVGEEIAKRSFPERIRNGVLKVKVSNSVWAQELTFQKQIILNRLKKHLSEGQDVHDIKFYVA